MIRLLLALALPLSAADPVGLRRELHQIPETGNREFKTAEKISAILKSMGAVDISSGAAKTGVTAFVRGANPGKTVALRAPIDALEVETAQGPKVMHACGHDAMTAMTLGAAELLLKERKSLHGSVKLIFQPAEEGAPAGEEAGAPLMVKEGVLNGVLAIVTEHVDETIPCGEAGVHPAAVYAGADTFSVKVQGQAAHGATPWKGTDAITAAAQIIVGLQQVASRQTDISDPVVVSVGTISGGSRSNSLAGEVVFAGTLRSYSASGRAKARESIARLVSNTAEALGAKAAVIYSEQIGPVVNDAALVARLTPVLERELGKGKVRAMKPMSYADDFSAMSEKVPSFYFQMGIRNEKKGITAGTHTEKFDVDEDCIPVGARLLAASARELLREP